MFHVKKLKLFFILFFLLNLSYAHNYGYSKVILNTVTTAPTQGVLVTSPTSNYSIDSYSITCTTKGVGSVSAQIDLYAYNSSLDVPTDIATLYNSGSDSDTTVIAGNVSWKYFYVTQSDISGTAATTTCTMVY